MKWLLSPLAWLLFSAVLVAWTWHRHRHLALAASLAFAALALAAMTPRGANALLKPLQRPFAAANGCAGQSPSVAIVLGGGVDGRPHGDADFSVLNLASRRRMDRAVAWWREDQGRTLVVQGGSPYPGGPSLARLMAAYAGALGVPAGAMRLETRSIDTWDNAASAAALVPRVPRRVVLVTSLVHMRRARDAFAGNGFEVCPLPADARRLPSRIPWALVPRTSGLANAEVALHEWAGLAYYRWRERRRPR
jgi:uncharacterized SAM-binding protein YcdF (DUF218 family)